MITVAIVDDSVVEAAQLRSYLDKYSTETGECINVKEFRNGFKFVDNYKAVYDVVFLDVDMSDLDGVATAHRLRQYDENVYIIFVTNFAKYAIQGYSVNALDYFLKPVHYEDLRLRMDAVRRNKSMNDYMVAISYNDGIKRLTAREIIYIESRGHDITLHTENGDYLYHGVTMKSLEKELIDHGFFRCNTSYIVNLSYVDGVSGNFVRVADSQLLISRARKKEFLQAVPKRFGG